MSLTVEEFIFDNAAKAAGTSEMNVSNDAVPVRQDELNAYISDTWEYDDTAIDTSMEQEVFWTRIHGIHSHIQQ